jgi:hypothetical protein
MRRPLLTLLAFLIIVSSALSGCIWWVGRDEERRQGYQGEHHHDHDHDEDRRPGNYNEQH